MASHRSLLKGEESGESFLGMRRSPSAAESESLEMEPNRPFPKTAVVIGHE